MLIKQIGHRVQVAIVGQIGENEEITVAVALATSQHVLLLHVEVGQNVYHACTCKQTLVHVVARRARTIDQYRFARIIQQFPRSYLATLHEQWIQKHIRHA